MVYLNELEATDFLSEDGHSYSITEINEHLNEEVDPDKDKEFIRFLDDDERINKQNSEVLVDKYKLQHQFRRTFKSYRDKMKKSYWS